MENQILSDFKKWLLSSKGLTTEKSAASYVSRLKRAFQLWDSQASFMRPIEANIDGLGVLCCTAPTACENIFTQMLGYIGAEYAKGSWLYGPTNDVATAVRAFLDFLKSRCKALSALSNENQEVTSLARIAQGIEVTDVFYPTQLNLRGRIASRDSKDWPASELNKVIGKNDEGSWITRTIKNIIVLTDKGIHHVEDIAEFKVGRNDILMARPSIYANNVYTTVYSYHANGTIHPFKVKRRANGGIDLSSISIEHSPAISIAINSGRFLEFQKLNQGQTVDDAKLKAEFKSLNKMVTYMLMERSQNSAKGNKW